MKRLINKIKNPQLRNRKSNYLLLILFILVVVGLGYLIASSFNKKPHQTNVAEVHVTKNGFEPASLVIKSGTKVIWINDDDKLHQIASNPYPQDDGLAGLKSEILNNQQSYEYTFEQAGSFNYHDDQNPTINATIEVHK